MKMVIAALYSPIYNHIYSPILLRCATVHYPSTKQLKYSNCTVNPNKENQEIHFRHYHEAHSIHYFDQNQMYY